MRQENKWKTINWNNNKQNAMSLKASQKQLRLAIDALFIKYDADNSGTLDTNEVKNILNDSFKNMGQAKHASEDDVKKFLGSVDENSDGQINKQQLFLIFKRIIDTHSQ